jgi:hypothetical protein
MEDAKSRIEDDNRLRYHSRRCFYQHSTMVGRPRVWEFGRGERTPGSEIRIDVFELERAS